MPHRGLQVPGSAGIQIASPDGSMKIEDGASSRGMEQKPQADGAPAQQSGEPPLFSVIVPTYGDGDRLRRSVGSVLDQTFQDFELLVVDDAGDPPATLDLDDPRIRLIRRPMNGGAGAARNTGLRAATGEWAVFLDADDEFLPKRLEVLAEALEQGKVGPADAITTDMEVYDADGSISLYSEERPFAETDQVYHQIRHPFLTALFAARREHLLGLGGFDEDLTNGEDSDLLLRLIFDGGTIHYVDQPLARYYRGIGKSSNRKRLWASQVVQLHKILARDLESDERQAALERLRYVRGQLSTATVRHVREELLQGRGERGEILRSLTARSARGGTRILFALGLVSPRLGRAAGRILGLRPDEERRR
jgi:glycosyltransferase involved in cell wall biosynthesis